MAKKKPWLAMPSWWVVVIAGGLCLTFCISIVRELMNSHQVRQQVSRLADQVGAEEERQRQLQDLIDYLGSPTFQEQEARLKLGLKKTGEQVIVVPPTNADNPSSDNASAAVVAGTEGAPLSNPARWWQYFFHPRSSTDLTNA